MFKWFANTFERNVAAFSDILANQPKKPDEALADWHDFIQATKNQEVTRAAMIIAAHIFHLKKVLEDMDSENSE